MKVMSIEQRVHGSQHGQDEKTIARSPQSPGTFAYLRNLAFLWNFVIKPEIFYRSRYFFLISRASKTPFGLSNLCS